MKDTYALCQGKFGRAVLLKLRASLVSHSHASGQIAFWLGGSPTKARIGDKSYEYKTDVALGINPFESHDATICDPNDPALFLTFEFKQSWIEEQRIISGKGLYFLKPTVPIDDELYSACHTLLNIMLNPFHSNYQNIEPVILDILIRATQASGNNIADLSTGLIRTPDYRVKRAIMALRSNTSRKMSVDQLADHVGLSRSQLHVLFRKDLNSTPSVVANLMVVEEAMRRMLNHQESLIDIALDLGFSSQGNFSRFFKEHMGVSPSVYRSAARSISTVDFLSD
ncbi:AraC family transcriptional regulator [Paenalcaligenes niemegkensis]|uniref:helix-turn-helix domain-containing protein n=1 Tax=Paenalcaligenes niemegkensis TaxID=2895469 RepID=UPI001EE990A0|nr:AraC family transcriptional regulator [Paenalcaligenes niemegkensis]MCQ9616377.1 AraC family transcriptional regulator [Paenalcaligenes niemegkensis]